MGYIEDLIREIINKYTNEKLIRLLRRIAPTFRPVQEPLDFALRADEPFSEARQLGLMEFRDATTVLVAAVRVEGELTARTSRRKQYDLAKRVLKATNHNGGIFAFHDDAGRFRLSLVTVTYHGTRRQFSTFRRYTFFVDPDLPNKTFFQQFRKADFSTLEGILETFSLEAVSDEFYREFKPKFDRLAESVQGTNDPALQQDFALLFVIRTIFLGFVQKKGWLGRNPRFLQDFWREYQLWKHANRVTQDRFYRDWLEPLFFEALSAPPGRKVAYGHAPFSQETRRILQMSPYLNGELFRRKRGIDDRGLWLPDALIGDFFDFLFQYNFTVEENELYDEELELNPEFLGIIFERLTNMEQGAVYTPRVEVDMMCRLALVKWLERTTDIPRETLYRLFFPAEDPREARLTPEQVRILIDRLESVTVCDPAAGSGAFEVGMLQVLDRTLEDLYNREETPAELRAKAPSPFERKKAIIARSLYGVEVKRWAVWINHLRLWLTLFVDMPDAFRHSFEPLLPNLTFKVRVGDSLVQRIGDKIFPVHGHADLPTALKRRITQLKQKKRDFFYNRLHDYGPIEREELDLFRAILDAEIAARQEKIRKLREPLANHLAFLEEVARAEAARQEARKAERERQIAELQAEIANLQAQKRSLKDERPFIWSIEFAEIFFDRGGFDIIIGNPPYVRQEEISDPNQKLSVRDYKAALMEMVRLDFPEYFAKSRSRADEFRKDRKPSGRSDLYTYFYIRSLRLLNPRGVHVFICSNAWMDTRYGAWLQEFFLRKTPLYLVIDNHARRTFARADINTVITVAAAPLPGRQEVPKDHIVRFVAFKRPFEEVLNAENFVAIEGAEKVRKTPDFRVFPITVGELLREGSEPLRRSPHGAIEADGPDRVGEQLREGSEPSPMGSGKYVGDKWGGKYLRAPDIFFTILEKGKGKLVRLGEIAEVRFGIKTGANDFFYLEPLGPGSRPGLVRVRNGAGWEGEIEEEFLKPVIKSPREVKTIVIDPSQLKYRIFMCHKSKEELKGTKALEYIEWGERQGYHRRSTLRSRRRWWDLGKREPGPYLWPMIHNDRLVVFLNSHRVQVDHNLFEVIPSQKKEFPISLFSILSVLIRELYGRRNLGEGALKTEGVDIVLFPIIVARSGENIKNRPIHSIFTEIGIDPTSDVPISEQEPKPLPDRKALDDIVFDALGLTEEERKEVYRAVAQLVWERISKAKSTKRRR